MDPIHVAVALSSEIINRLQHMLEKLNVLQQWLVTASTKKTQADQPYANLANTQEQLRIGTTNQLDGKYARNWIHTVEITLLLKARNQRSH